MNSLRIRTIVLLLQQKAPYFGRINPSELVGSVRSLKHSRGQP